MSKHGGIEGEKRRTPELASLAGGKQMANRQKMRFLLALLHRLDVIIIVSRI